MKNISPEVPFKPNSLARAVKFKFDPQGREFICMNKIKRKRIVNTNKWN